MAKYKLIVMCKPTAGNEVEFNRWYTDDHLKDVLEVPGILAAQRLKYAAKGEGSASYPYCAIYDLECSDPDGFLTTILSRYGTEKMPSSPSIDLDDLYCVLYEEITGRVVKDTRR